MENLALFATTTLVYLGVWCWMKKPNGLAEYAKRAGIIALLCAPFNINGHIFTVLGNAVSEKNNIALCSLYQKAGQNVITIGLSGYQSAGQSAQTIIGLTLYQKAGEKTRTFGIFSELNAK